MCLLLEFIIKDGGQLDHHPVLSWMETFHDFTCSRCGARKEDRWGTGFRQWVYLAEQLTAIGMRHRASCGQCASDLRPMRLFKIAPLLRADEDKSHMRVVIYKLGGNDDA